MRTSLHAFCRLVTVILIVLMLTMTVVVNSLVVTRYFFSYSPSWTEEVTRYSMVWMVMLGAAVLTLFDDHISLNMAVDKLPPKLRRWQRLFVAAVVAGIGALITWKGYEFAFSLDGVLAPGLQMNMLYPAIAIPIGGAFISLFAILRIVNVLIEISGGEGLPFPDQLAFMDGSFKTAEDDTAPGAGHAHSHQHHSPDRGHHK